MSIIQKLQNWFTKSNKPSKQNLQTEIAELQQKLAQLHFDYADVTNELKKQCSYADNLLNKLRESDKKIERLKRQVSIKEKDKKRLKKYAINSAKEIKKLKTKNKFLVIDNALMEERYKDVCHLLVLPYAIRHNLLVDYKRSYIETVNYVGGKHVFKH